MALLSFSGHETFPLRFTWLKKAVDAVEADPRAFASREAIAAFGVGKNMVRAIRYWALAAGIVEPHPEDRQGLHVTERGRFFFGAEGVDPYLEDPATLWLLHWWLCREEGPCTLWHFVFGHWTGGALDLPAVQAALAPWLAERAEEMPAPATLRRDLQCLVNTYAPSRSARARLENVVGSPLVSLGLIQTAGGTALLQRRPHAPLSPEVFAYAVLDFWDRVAPGRETLDVGQVLHERAGPGRLLLLSEARAFEHVEALEARPDPPFVYRDSAGIRQLYRRAERADALLPRLYALTA